MNKLIKFNGLRILALALFTTVGASTAGAEAMLQLFNTSWRDMADKIPELAEAGYSSLWLPPPTKGSGGLSVGYDLWDPFDIGGRNQRSTVATRYGTEAELLNLVEVAHRFGIRVYFDNIMNHRAFDVPGYNESTPVDVYPGMVPEDFHLRVTADGFYRKWDNVRSWNDGWQVQYLNFSDLIDIAHENPNGNFGYTEGSSYPKPRFIRHPSNPEFYDRMPNTNMPPAYSDPWDWAGNTDKNVYVGFGTNNGITTAMLAAYPDFFSEDVGGYLLRAVRWLMSKTKADGLRLDAVKHVPDYFFGSFDDNTSNNGYTGNVQWQFNMSRGFSDWDNHRDSLFNTEIPRDDAILFGEHLGQPPGYGGYWSAGMRLVDNDLREQLNNRLGNPSAGLDGFDQPGWGGFAPNLGVMHAQSHDNDYAARRELQHAFYFLREGMGLLYSDGNFHSETLGESGGAFPRWANTAYLGQWGDNRIPNLLNIHEQFARGYQRGVYSDGDYVAWERMDGRQGGSSDADKVTMLVMLNDNYANGASRDIRGSMSFPSSAYLFNYSDYYYGFYTYASNLNTVIVPSGGYFVFGWKNPDPAPTWTEFGGTVVTIEQNGKPVETVRVTRRDGPDGDPGFNPYGLPDTNATDFAYSIDLPRVTVATNLSFISRTDGSAGNVLFKLDGGMDLNGTNGLSGDLRDNPPALAYDLYLGYEQAAFVKRIWAEKFSAADSNRNKIGSAGAETYQATIGQSNWTINTSSASNDFNSANNESAWIYHDPTGMQDGPRSGNAQFWPPPKDAGGSQLYVGIKTPKSPGNEVWFYYTTNGLSWPEGAGGAPGNADTRVVEASWVGDGAGSNDWWEAVIPAMPSGTVFRYKTSVFKRQSDGNGWWIAWPGDPAAITLKRKMLTEHRVTNFNATTISYRPHNDYGQQATGLKDGFHIISARAFLNRNDGAAVYNTFKQTFYLDTETPRGYIQWPANDNDTVSGSEYGVVVRTDPTVREVWYRIEDADPSNDSTNHANGVGNIWKLAQRTTPSDMGVDSPSAWRFNYSNIAPGNSNATIRVRLREWSSAPRSAWSNESLTEAQGHYTELVRTVKADGSAYRLYFDWPSEDGTLVEAGWELRVKYSAQYASGLDDAGALSLFTIKLNSVENGGDPTNGVILSHEDISISHQWDWPNENMITFKMPNVYNGKSDWLHSLEVRGVRTGYPTITATRQVKTVGELLPSIMINVPPEVDSDGQPYVIILPDVPPAQLATNPALRTTPIELITSTNAVETGILFVSPSGYTGNVTLVSSTNMATSIYWQYSWSNLVAGTYRFTAWVKDSDGKTNTASRNARLRLLQVVDMSNTNILDHDNDGMTDEQESTPLPLPNGFEQGDPRYQPNPEFWTNFNVFIHDAAGKSLPESPDSDGDGLPDSLELGWRIPHSSTDTNADTNADGWPNFMPDLDPPFYNTLDNYGKVPGVDSQQLGGDRSKRLRGSTTDPNNPDSDYDGIPDGVEDANRNGWVDGDGELIPPTWDPWAARDWPTGKWKPSWKETDPNNPDTDGDGLSDGYGEDQNFNGYIDGDTNSNRIWEAGELWQETDPLNPDTDGDGLSDGWEVRYNFDPLDDGVIGHTNMRTGAIISSTENGADGDPDGDGFSNLQEMINGTNPRVYDDPYQPPPANAITIGRGPAIGTINGVTNYQEFTDWTADDLIALDPYNTGGENQAVDIYRRWDGFDSSRDLVAFYMRDGGAADGKVYFRVDLHDLQPHAEESALNIYVVMDFNSPGIGEAALPDEVDTRTEMKWEAVVAVYDSSTGKVLVDNDPMNNTLTAWDSLSANGVVEVPGGFLGAYFNSDLDAVEFAIDRTALTDIGWNGNANTLNFQVFTTKDGTCNTCNGGNPGAGDIGGRSDITDTIRTDWIASDYSRDQVWISQNGVLTQWIGMSADNDRGKAAKIAFLSHGNQAIQPGSTIQHIVNDGNGAGYERPIKSHGLYHVPLNLHITPTLAIGLQWAEVKNGGPQYRSGRALNDLIRELAASNIVSLLASTYSDHALPYFSSGFNADNLQLASDTLHRIYGVNITSNSIFWAPERLLGAEVYAGITNLGFRYTLADQNTHIFNWLGRQTALGDDGYRINRINGVNNFVINTAADANRFINYDGGLPLPMRELYSRRARSDRQDQVATVFAMWEEFANKGQADAYDKNLRWLANHPWIKIVALSDIAAGNIPLPNGQHWDPIDRGNAAANKQSHDWINHANNENYDNWYNGSARHEGLKNKKFLIRPGVTNALAYGQTGASGIASSAWAKVAAIANPDVKRLASEVIHASVFETAFHNESNNDLTRWSFGGYVNPASDPQTLIDFARIAQNQTRMAAIYSWVDSWAASASGMSATATASLDVDLDGEAESLLYNKHVAAVFERSGGRMIAAWIRTSDNRVRQVIGNLASYAGEETENEGTAAVFVSGNTTNASTRRTSALKDWWAGTNAYINQLYTPTTNGVVNGWKLSSSSSNIVKTITLAPTATAFAVEYQIKPALNGGVLYVRNGFSPDLSSLLVQGQRGMTDTVTATSATVSLQTAEDITSVALTLSQGVVNQTATDDNGAGFDSVPMRNQAQTRQVEIVGTNSLAFTLGFSVQDSANEPPELTFVPPGPYTNAVGTTNAFMVQVSDPDGDPVALGVGALPFTATFNTNSGAFAWWVTNMGSAGTTSTVSFTANDGTVTVTNFATIIVPWDANGNDIPDDWEYLWFHGDMSQTKDGDADGDGFPNYAEWIASTDPMSSGSFIGWESQYAVNSNTVNLTFRSVPNRWYHIEGNDGVLSNPNQWMYLGSVQSSTTNTLWTDTNAVPTVRHYRIKIPAVGP